MTDDQFLHEARRPPRAEFTHALRQRLDRTPVTEPRRPHPARRMWLALAAAGLAVALAFTNPSVRASAQAFLDLFRVQTFAAVSVDPARIERLQSGAVDFKSLIGDHVQTLQDPGPPRWVGSLAAAGAATGLDVATPSNLPRGLRQDSIWVRNEGQARLTVDAAKLQQVLDALDIHDVTVPANLNGTTATVRMPPCVRVVYRNADAEAMLIQARSPEVTLPAGLDLARLGEIGLRIAGLSSTQAHRFAQTIDWHSTVLVPVPANASSFSEVTVSGQKGLLITTTDDRASRPRRWRSTTVLLWSSGGKVYALTGNIGSVDITTMANSVH